MSDQEEIYGPEAENIIDEGFATLDNVMTDDELETVEEALQIASSMFYDETEIISLPPAIAKCDLDPEFRARNEIDAVLRQGALVEACLYQDGYREHGLPLYDKTIREPPEGTDVVTMRFRLDKDVIDP